jgi:predicted dinucleotide-binding enzyme
MSREFMMKIAVLGTGMVGQALARRLTDLGHGVTVGTRDVRATMARTEPDAMGNPPYASWAQAHPQVRLATFSDATADAELVVNATSGSASMQALQAAGLDFSQGFPPSLFVSNTESLAEQIQGAFPDVKVVKALNTMNAFLMVDPRQLADGDHSVFVSGNDTEAKQIVSGLLESFGHTDIIDLGDITTARGSEMMLPIWTRLYGVLGVPLFQFKVVR